MPNYESFIFTHIPKCGGTSFRRYIVDLAKYNGIPDVQIYAPGLNGLANDKNLVQLSPIEIGDLNKLSVRVLADHTLFEEHLTFGLECLRNPFYYTILREPVSRFISHYNFFCYKLGNRYCKDLRLVDLSEEQLEDVLMAFSNLQIRYLTNFKKGLITHEILDKAKINLRYRYTAFGILESIQDSIETLVKILPNWLLAKYQFPILNSNKIVSPSDVPPSIIKEIQNYNALEIDLYQWASELNRF